MTPSRIRSRGGFDTASKYIRALVREVQERDAEDRPEAKLLEALAGPSSDDSDE